MTAPVQVKKLHPRAKLPTYGSVDAAGADLYALTDGPVDILPGQTVLLRTGLALAIPKGYVGLTHARSGLATRQGLAPANKVGVIDADYRGELMVALHNHGQERRTIHDGDRVAQSHRLLYGNRCAGPHPEGRGGLRLHRPALTTPSKARSPLLRALRSQGAICTTISPNGRCGLWKVWEFCKWDKNICPCYQVRI